ncbi:hypothetical protein NQ176_g4310 [Zarea fungicola]|uniref:Uncharacterized protein n=1 Tax=Zarea fungicola TaxID=93591 RepID=A0ACC1NER7_9HYPO|nr:hypothetical protein NQ176_g4310 [Lecanicillium fungicola]
MSAPVTETTDVVAKLIEATEFLSITTPLCTDWEQRDSLNSDSVDRYLAALPDIHACYKSKGAPSALPPIDGRLQGHGYAMTEHGYCDIRPHTERPHDVDTTDKPLAEAERYLGVGYKILENWTEGSTWKPGNLWGDDGSDPKIMEKTVTGIPRADRANVSDPRVETSTGHIPVYTRPQDAGLGWGGFDSVLAWQAAGRAVHADMTKDEKWNTDLTEPIKFVDKTGKVHLVKNIFSPEELSSRPEPPVALHDLLHGQKRGFQRRS